MLDYSVVRSEFMRDVNNFLRAGSSVCGGKFETSIVHLVILNGYSAEKGKILFITYAGLLNRPLAEEVSFCRSITSVQIVRFRLLQFLSIAVTLDC